MNDSVKDDEGLAAARERFVAGALDEAGRLARRCLTAAKAAGDVVATARARILCAEVAYDRLRYTEARDEMRRAVAELSSQLPPGHDEQRYARASLALVLNSLDDVEGAKAELALAAADLELPEAGTTGTPLVRAQTWLVIAIIDSSLVLRGRSREILERLLEIVPDADDLHRAARATLHLHLATALEAAGLATEALAHEEQCIETRTRLWGSANPRVVAAKFGLARLLLALQRIEDARKLTRGTMTTLVQLGMDREPRMSMAYATAGLAELMSGDVEAGTQLFERGCALEERTFGTSDPNTAHMLVMVAQVHASRRNWGKVVGLCKRILPALQDSTRWADAHVTAWELDCNALTALGRAPEGTTRLRDALTKMEARRNAPPRRAELWLLLGRTELAIGREKAGLQALERAGALAREHDLDEVEVAADRDLEHVRQGGRIGLKGSA